MITAMRTSVSIWRDIACQLMSIENSLLRLTDAINLAVWRFIYFQPDLIHWRLTQKDMAIKLLKGKGDK